MTIRSISLGLALCSLFASACSGGVGSVIPSRDAGSGSGGSGGAAGADGGADAGRGGGGNGGGGEPDASVPDTGGAEAFVAVQAILAANCTRCHDPAHPFVPETQTFVDLALTPGGAYAALVNKPAHETCGGVLVIPGDPARSYLYHKVTDDKPCDGERMPHSGMIAGTKPLPLAEIETIAAWIQNGAKN